MDELVKLVAEKTGIPEKTARQAVEIVINYLKEKLPAPIAAQIDNALKKGSSSGDISSNLVNLLGSKK